MYKTIKKFLNDGGKCLLIEDGKPVGVVLTIEEYEFLQSKPQTPPATHPIDFPQASAEISDIEATNDITLGDLGVDELPY